MNPTGRSLILLTLALAATFGVSELVALEATIGISPNAVTRAEAPLARIDEPVAMAAGRRCDSLDSFGNPIRPCRA